MKSMLVTISIFLLPICLTAQITGKINTDDGTEIPFANVLLLNSDDSTFVEGTLSENDGSFLLKKSQTGDYLVKVSLIGFQDWTSPPFSITENVAFKDLGIIVLAASSFELEGIEVKAERMLFESTMEGKVINVQNSILTSGSSAFQLLQRSPGVIIDERQGDFTLNGQNGTLIMINGKRIRMSNAEIINLLNGMSADNVQKIELITNPSAKYDAEGSGGIINIVLKKNETEGTNGTVSLTFGYGWGEKEAASLSINHRKNNINLYGTYSFSNDHTFSNWRGIGSSIVPSIGGENGFDFTNNTSQKNLSHNILIGFETDINSNTLLGISTNLNRFHNNVNVLNEGKYFFPQDSFLLAQINNIGNRRWDNYTSSFFIERKLKENSLLKFNLDHLYFKNNAPSTIQNNYFNKNDIEVFPEHEFFVNENRGTSTTDINIGVAKLDYEYNLSKNLELETGLKLAYSVSNNESSIDRKEGDIWVTDDRNISSLENSERIGAAYISLAFKIDSTSSFNLGTRYEYWDRQFNETSLNRSFGKFFPSLFYSKQISNSSTLRLSYNKRITRPAYNDLASPLSYNGPFSVFAGNTLLKPSITNNLKLSLQHHSTSFSLIYTREENPIVRYQIVENEQSNLVYITPQNVDIQNGIWAQIDIPRQINNWWSMNLGANGGWRKFNLSYTLTPIEKSYWHYTFYGSQNFNLPKDISLELSGWYVSNHFNGSIKVDGFGMLNFGIRKKLKNNWGSIQFSITDVLKSMNIRSEIGAITREAFDSLAKVHFQPESTNARIFKISYSTSFGGKKVKGKSYRAGVEEEKARLIQN